MTGEVGSYRYMAPELVKHERYNSKVDIYSWAILSWEVLAIDKPFTGIAESTFLKVRGAVNCRNYLYLTPRARSPCDAWPFSTVVRCFFWQRRNPNPAGRSGFFVHVLCFIETRR